VLSAALVACGGRAFAQAKEHTPPDVERLDGYLERLGIAKLRIRNLERELERPHPLAAIAAIAARLAEVYAERLASVTEPKELADLSERLNRLIAAHATAGSPRVRLTLLEGDYNRAEPQALKWVGNPADLAARADALTRLGKCRPALDQARDELLKHVQRLDDQADNLDAGPRRDAVEAELRTVSQSANRAVYFASWANFYERLLSPAASGEGFRVARLGFRRLLGIEEEAPKAGDFEGLDAETTARMTLGLALSELADGHPESARAAFVALHGPAVHPSVRDWVDRWQVWALLEANRGDDALSVAQAAIDRIAPPFAPAKAALCSLLIRGVRSPQEGAAGPGPARPDELKDRLAVLGLRGLIRLGRFDLARAGLGKRDLSAAAPPGALAHWLRGQAALNAAETGPGLGSERYSNALAAFTAALAASPEPALAADCRFGQAWCYYRSGDAAQARDAFRRVASELKAQGLPTADAEWMALLTEWSLADLPPDRRLERIAEEARAFREAHPDHPGAGRADELVARLRRELSSTEDLAKDSAKDPATRLAIAKKLHKSWGALAAVDRAASPQTASLSAVVGEALAQIQGDANPGGRFDLLMMSVDLALAANPPDRERARAALNEAQALSVKRPPGDPGIIEDRFRRFQLARADGDAAAVREHATWLVAQPGAASHERACLTALAEQADEDFHAASGAERPARAAAALKVHRRLASALADFPDRVKTNPTLRLVYLRLARYGLDAGKPEVALRYLTLLRIAKPDDPEILRLFGLANLRAGHSDRALECWRELLQRLPGDSAAWFEAKFHQIETIAQTDGARARRVWEQFQTLHPELGPGPWPDQFRQLAARLP
jgi:tetratricopeptide (TPR) repeat protein